MTAFAHRLTAFFAPIFVLAGTQTVEVVRGGDVAPNAEEIIFTAITAFTLGVINAARAKVAPTI